MQKRNTLLLSFALWFASMFIKVAEWGPYPGDDEINRIYVFGLYGWLVAFFREPARFVADSSALMASGFFLVADFVHFGVCFVVIWIGVWLYRLGTRLFRRRLTTRCS